MATRNENLKENSQPITSCNSSFRILNHFSTWRQQNYLIAPLFNSKFLIQETLLTNKLKEFEHQNLCQMCRGNRIMFSLRRPLFLNLSKDFVCVLGKNLLSYESSYISCTSSSVTCSWQFLSLIYLIYSYSGGMPRWYFLNIVAWKTWSSKIGILLS